MLGGVFVALTLLAAAMLFQVLSTVFFAVTVAYLLSPVHRRLHRRGLSRWLASAATTTAAFLSTLALLSPLAVILVLRLNDLVSLLRSLPESVAVEVWGMRFAVTTEQALELLIGLLQALAREAAAAAPVLLTKLALFALLVFALLHHQDEARRAVLAVVPPTYRSVAEALNERARATLFAIYVLQAATAAGTFLIAVPVFVALGYPYPLTLAVACALLQFLPIVGPGIVLGLLAVYHLLVGEVLAAGLVILVGGILVGWLPDLLIRPRLARETANLPGSLYFVGFVGGLLTLGPIGVIAGPLVVALVVETAGLLSAELNEIPVSEP